MITVRVKVDTSGMEAFNKEVERGLSTPGTVPEIDAMFKRWGERNRAFLQRRFNTYSRGGGDWPPLAPATIARRRNKSTKGVSILRDTNTMYLALNPQFTNKPGQFELRVKDGVVLGFGGSSKHPEAKPLTVERLAEIHNNGEGKVPIRRIIVIPDERTLNGMTNDGQNALEKIAARSNRR